MSPPKKSVWYFSPDLGVVWWAMPHGGASATAAEQHGCSLKGPGHFRKQVVHFKELVCAQGWESDKPGRYTGSSFSNSSSYFLHVYCLFCYPSKSEFLKPARKKKKQKTPIYIELLSCIGTELQSALLTGKCQRKTPPVFLELRAGITPVALGVPSAWCPRVLPCSSPSIPWLGIKFCANILDELINKAVEVVKFIHKEGMLLIGVCCDGFQFILGCPSNSHGVSYNSWKETQSLE